MTIPHTASKRKKIIITGIALFAMLTMVVGVYTSMKRAQTTDTDFSGLHAAVLDQPRPLPEQFNLVTDENQPFTNKQLEGQWSLLFFGFTNCPHICPMALNDLAKVYKLLNESDTNNLPQIMLVTVDPERDTVEDMHAYVKAFNPAFTGVTGEKSELDKLVAATGTVYMKHATNQSMHYDVPHSDAIVLVNPNGNIAAFFTSPHNPEVIAKEYQLITG